MKLPSFVSITRPDGLPMEGRPGHTLTPEQYLAFVARVSSPQNQDNHDTAEKLLRYCLVNAHWSVFETVTMTLQVHTSRAIMAQILRHHSFRFQEFSQRYAPVDIPLTPEGWRDVEMRFTHDKGNRQGSDEDSAAPMGLSHMAQVACAESAKAYRRLLEADIAPECARMVLPLATPTTAYMIGSIRSWITYFWQRGSGPFGHAQKEHRKQVADPAFDIFREHFPALAQIVSDGIMRYVTYEELETLKLLKSGKATVVLGA